MKRSVKKALAATAALGVGWGLYSARQAMKPVPPESEAFDYLRSNLKDNGLDHLLEKYTTDTVMSDGIELKLYLFESSPGDPAVVFVPGTSVYALLYTEFLSKLSDRGYNVIGYDCRGHGLSGGRRGSYTIGQLVDDTRNVISYAIERFGDRVAVAGSSQGGIIAFHTAAADTRLGSAVCHNLLAPDEPDNYRATRYPGLYEKILKLMPLAPVMPRELRVPVSWYLDIKAEPSVLIPDLQEAFHTDPLVVSAVSLGALISLSSTPLEVPVEEIEVPIMAIHSELDNIFPEDYIRRVFDRITAKKKMLLMKGRPHLVMIDFVDELMPEVASWLDETLKRPADD